MRVDHLKLSDINLYAACPGSANMIAAAPKRPQTDAQREGILAHKTVFNLIHGLEVPSDADQEMIDHACNYLESLDHILADKNVIAKFEAPVDLYMSHNQTIHGVADFLAYDEKSKTVIVHDYKYGQTPVDIETDLQTVIYAFAAFPLAESAAVSIEQPRSFGEKRSTRIYDAAAYRKIQIYAHGVLFDASYEDAKLIPGAHCAKCPARNLCPSVNYNALNLAESAQKYPVMNESDSSEMSRELSFLTRVKTLVDARIDALKDEITHRIKFGERVFGYTLESASSRLEWTIAKERIQELATTYGVDLFKPQEPLTPLQAVKKGIPLDEMKKHTVKKWGALKLREITQEEISKKLNLAN
jgi:hypothetical protein